MKKQKIRKQVLDEVYDRIFKNLNSKVDIKAIWNTNRAVWKKIDLSVREQIKKQTKNVVNQILGG